MEKKSTTRYIMNAILSFDKDPPDSDYQRGYLQALKDVRDKK